MTRSFTLLAFTPLLVLPAVAGCGMRARAEPQPAPARAAAAEPAVTVTTAAVVTESLPRTLTLTGTLIANRESAVAADVSGKVAEVFVERGSRVRAGAPLIQLDRRQAALVDDEARAQAAAVEAQAGLARSECARAEKLFADGAINQAEFDRSKAQCQATALSAQAAQARSQLAGKTLTDLVVRAPFAGVVADRFINPGEYVRPDSRVASVVQLHPLRLELSVPEHALAAFRVGADVAFTVAAWPGQTFTGKIVFGGATVRRATRDLLVEALVDNKDERLRPGMFAVAQVKLGEAPTPVVPRSALRTDDRAGTDRLYIVHQGKVEERLVHTGTTAGDRVAIVSGVQTGEQVVLSPTAAIRDGLRVR
jgi:membrane fusion protein (multidrug efflux system)